MLAAEIEKAFKPKMELAACEYVTADEWLALPHPRGGNYPPLFVARYRAQAMESGAVVGVTRKYDVLRDGSLRRRWHDA